MLKKSFRLRTKEDFERVFRKGTPLFFGALACKIAKNELGHIRLGFSFGKKHLEKAVSRNRLRRTLSEPFSDSVRNGQSKAVDVVFFSVKKPQPGELKTVASVAKNVVEYINQ